MSVLKKITELMIIIKILILMAKFPAIKLTGKIASNKPMRLPLNNFLLEKKLIFFIDL
jgi:hypothetical protein